MHLKIIKLDRLNHIDETINIPTELSIATRTALTFVSGVRIRDLKTGDSENVGKDQVHLNCHKF